MKLLSLQILRAFAAIWVVITHVFQKSDFKPFEFYYLSGQYGVDIFFILSGFLIYITTKNQANHWSYLKKRVYRIYPLYLVALVFYLIFQFNYQGLEINFIKIVQNVLMLPWDEKWSYGSLIIGVAWSTLFEMFFYILFFLLIFFKLNRRWILFVIPLLLIVFGPVSYFKLADDNMAFVSLFISLASSFHLIPFLAGCVIGELYVQNKIPKINKQLYLFFLVLSIISIGMLFLIRYNFYVSFVASVLLFLTVLQYEKYYQLNTQNTIVKSAIYLGDISYSMYILHILIINILIIIFDVINIPLLMVLTLTITTSLSSITYHFVEKIFIELGKK